MNEYMTTARMIEDNKIVHDLTMDILEKENFKAGFYKDEVDLNIYLATYKNIYNHVRQGLNNLK